MTASRHPGWRYSLLPAREAYELPRTGLGLGQAEKKVIAPSPDPRCFARLVATGLLQLKYGRDRIPVAYLSDDGDVISAGHVVTVLPDGWLLDPTRDQFGEGHSASVIAPGSGGMARYRPEFLDGWHPGSAGPKACWMHGCPSGTAGTTSGCRTRFAP